MPAARQDPHSEKAVSAQPPPLRRVLSLPLITFYGLGTILGAGIYVLVGKIAGVAGLYAPLAFLIAAAVAALTGFSYAELTSRYPRAGGESIYVQQGFGIRALSTLVGLLVAAAGLVSAATITRGFVGYLDVFVALPATLVIVAVVLLLCGLAIWGILESAWAAAIATMIEIAGLLLIIAVASPSLASLPARWPELLPAADAAAWSGIMLGAFLAFYAFIGFEDMANVAEEVQDASRNLPRAILFALALATTLYLLVALVAVLSLPPAQLAASAAPLALIFEHSTGHSPTLIAAISLFAVVNGALIQIIMASRMLYGMSAAGWLPGVFAQVSTVTGTPVIATVTAASGVLLCALALPLATLAKATSTIVLVVFALVNLALIRIKQRDPAPAGARVYAGWIPWGGLLLSLALLAFHLLTLLRG
ncbi:MAG: APC family permease [Burkholderiales bacterium]|nr:APC family permease [Burkholderiales bacterium]